MNSNLNSNAGQISPHSVSETSSKTVSEKIAGKNIVLGICGGIAAYKCADLTRRLIERGVQVRVVMTDSAKEFITPLTMQAVSGHPVSDSLLDPSAEASMGHIELAKWADLVLIAPATANTIAKLNAGMADDLLSTLVLATQAPVAISPAMNQQMYANAATQQNISALKQRGMMIWGPTSGSQACGDIGMGRMLESMELVHHCEEFFLSLASDLATNKSNQPWQNIKLVITAGPTQEALDPVRYLTNKSSGKMGYAIAEAAANLGAQVTLISGPVALETPADVTRINVETAQQMHDASLEHAKQNQIFIACAAVADYRPAEIADQKIKKTDDSDTLILTMVKNPDIVASVASLAEQRPFTVGFAAETQDVEQYAKAKLQRKNLDMICANDVSNENSGFNSVNNSLTLYWDNGSTHLPETDKKSLAYQLLEQILIRVKS